MKYLFNNVEFDPDGKPQILVNGKAQKTSGQKPVEVLQYLLDNNGIMKERDDIIANVWGQDANQTSYEALSVAIARANTALAKTCRIESVRGIGYRIKVDLTKVYPPQNQTIVVHEKLSLHKPTLMICLFGFMIVLLALYSLSTSQLAPVTSAQEAPSYTLKDNDEVFMANKAVSRPLISPDENYIAHRLLNDTDKDGFLAVTEVATGKTTNLGRMLFADGFRWNIAGDKIVYQTRINKKCEIRLAHLNLNKTLAQDELLTSCEQNSGRLSFVWFNEHEFYFNPVDANANSKGLPLHQLYSFNTQNKTATKLLSTQREGGVGFYSLEYDSTNKALYVLKINDKFTSDVYRYQNAKLAKLTSADQLIYYYGLFNERLVYVNQFNELVMSKSAADLTRNSVVLPSIKVPISHPNIVDDKLTFLAGHLFSNALHKITNGSVIEVDLAGYIPNKVASHNNLLVFTSKQTGANQIYKQLANGTIVQLSDFTQHAIIEHISVVSDLLAVSHINRVDFYYIKDNKLTFINSITGFTNGVLSQNEKTILVTQVDANKNEQKGDIVELQLIDFAPTGLKFNKASTAIYGSERHSEIIYINERQQLMGFYNGQHRLLLSSVVVKNTNSIKQHNNKVYYVAENTQKLMAHDLISQKALDIDLRGLKPRNIIINDGELLIVTKQAVAPKLMIGKLVVNK